MKCIHLMPHSFAPHRIIHTSVKHMSATTAGSVEKSQQHMALFCVAVTNLEDAPNEETNLLRNCSTGFWRSILPELRLK